jgi:DNA repair ATPase RecN
MCESLCALQVACYADLHLRVKKAAFDDGRTASVFEPLLTHEQRVEEIAAMLGMFTFDNIVF